MLVAQATERRKARKARRQAAARLQAERARVEREAAKAKVAAERQERKATRFLPAAGEADRAALGAPGLSPVAYWITTAAILAGLVALGDWGWVTWRRRAYATDTDSHRLAGIATRHEITQVASDKALLKRTSTLRPSLTELGPGEVEYRLGTSKGQGVWASVEDSILLVGSPRSGKGLHIIIPAILGAPGPVVTTSTRPDNLTATLRARQRCGPGGGVRPPVLDRRAPGGDALVTRARL